MTIAYLIPLTTTPREALREAFAQPPVMQAGASWRDMLHQVPGVDPRSPADAALVRRTVENMRRAGELELVSTRQAAGRGRPLLLLRRAASEADAWATPASNDATAELASLLSAWGT